jgi:hypothetical protein
MKNRKEQFMRKLKLILAATAALALAGDAFAIDAPELDQEIINLTLYHNRCAPLSDKLHETVSRGLAAMNAKERTRAIMASSGWRVSIGEERFCKTMEPEVKKLER